MLENAQQHGLRLKPGWIEQINVNPLDRMHNSRTGLWRLWRPAIRKIPEGAKIHESVLLRAKEIEDYNPSLPSNFTEVAAPLAKKATSLTKKAAPLTKKRERAAPEEA
jgi:hypothetical protein